MGDEYEGERRKQDIDIARAISRIEVTLETIRTEISARFASCKCWQAEKEAKCKELEETIVKLRISQAMQSVKIGLFCFFGSVIIAVGVAYFTK